VWHPSSANEPLVLDLLAFFKDVAAEDDDPTDSVNV
jgi:hypothetical protein